ncbi:MAG: FAD-binding protein, partial [Bacteroidaceae bacterium]|nr:FAD-binding protein [Bacteroidaceae bacterium]
YTMGGIWVDYELQTTIPGLFAIGECNFSDHGANRLGASALVSTRYASATATSSICMRR